jgi:glyceraldehyde-3-phosphate dehydrogenase (NADP+) (phosphorylating)
MLLSEFSGLRSAASLPLRRNATSEDFVSSVSFKTNAVLACSSSFLHPY